MVIFDVLIIVGAAALCAFAVGFISVTFSRRMNAIDRARDRAELGKRIDDLELDLGIREMTDAEVMAQERLGPNVLIDDRLREHARSNWERGRQHVSQFPRPTMQEIGRRP